MSYKVFISFGWHDRWIAKQFARLISESGATPWIATSDIDFGDDIAETIRDALHECDELVALVTPWSIDRNWILAEISGAWSQRKRFTVIFYGKTLDDLEKVHGGTTFIREVNVARLDEFDHYVEELKLRVAKAR